MGAYANPQEIEGQQDLAGHARALQNMFNTVTAGAQQASENITKIRISQSERINNQLKETAARNQKILAELNEKEQGMRVLVAKGEAAAPAGMNYDCYDSALVRWRELQKNIDYGTATNADKREAAQIMASVDGFVKSAANTKGIIEKIHTAKNNIGDGSIDIKGSDPYLFRAYTALDARDGDKIQPGFRSTKDKEGNEILDYSQPGYVVKAWKEKVGDKEITNDERFISAKDLEDSLNGGSNGGIVFQKSFEGDNEKVRKAYQANKDGGGIFEYKNDVYTNKVTPAYLGTGYTRSTPLGTQGTGGITRQPMRVVDKEKVLQAVGTQVESVAIASASTPKEAASRYFNYIQPAFDEKNPNKDKYNKLPDYAKFEKMPEDFDYNTTIDINNDKGIVGTITKNSKAAFAQALPDSQPFGNPITISDAEYAWEKSANKTVPPKLKSIWNEVNKGGAPVIKSVTLPDGKVRNVLIAKDDNGVFLEIVGYNTKQ